MRVIDFAPPLIGLDSEFNTFRLGRFYAKHLIIGEKIALVDSKAKKIVGCAEVTGIAVGSLGQLLLEHACQNHSQLGLDPMTAPERLFGVMTKIYGPHIATVEKFTVVVKLRRLHERLSADPEAG